MEDLYVHHVPHPSPYTPCSDLPLGDVDPWDPAGLATVSRTSAVVWALISRRPRQKGDVFDA